ncbi:hypothetical protein RUND412_007972 [Rhizina undulata]
MPSATFTKPPRLVASTSTTYQCSISESARRERSLLTQFQTQNDDDDDEEEEEEDQEEEDDEEDDDDDDEEPTTTPTLNRFLKSEESNVFHSAQWSPDGTCILTTSEDNALRTFIVPYDLLTPSSSPKCLLPYSITHSAERVYSTAIYPLSTLSSPETSCFLAAARDQPIQLHSLLTSYVRASYPLIDPPTERYLTPSSLLFVPSNPNIFIAGTDSRISFFDLTRPGSGPTMSLKTTPYRKAPMSAERMKGIVSALSIVPGSGGEGTSILAAGTFSRCVGLYSGEGTGETIGVFSLDDGGGKEKPGGAGVTQLSWSKCGRYLYVAERKSDEVFVYDIRVAGERVESFKQRNAFTNQRLGIDVAEGLAGEVVGGGTDGVVRVWRARHGEDEAGDFCTPVNEWKAHEDPVTSAIVHPSGTIMATCSGTRKIYDQESGGEYDEMIQSVWDNSLKIWELV